MLQKLCSKFVYIGLNFGTYFGNFLHLTDRLWCVCFRSLNMKTVKVDVNMKTVIVDINMKIAVVYNYENSH